MATAKIETIPPIPVKPVRQIVLTLNETEARTLAEVLARVGGSEKTTARGYTSAIASALSEVGINDKVAYERITAEHFSAIYFNERSRKHVEG